MAFKLYFCDKIGGCIECGTKVGEIGMESQQFGTAKWEAITGNEITFIITFLL